MPVLSSVYGLPGNACRFTQFALRGAYDSTISEPFVVSSLDIQKVGQTSSGKLEDSWYHIECSALEPKAKSCPRPTGNRNNQSPSPERKAPRLKWWIPYASMFVTALVVTLAATPLARIIATRLGAVDKPSKRRINKVAVPRMGGIAIFVAIACAVAVQYLGHAYLKWPPVFSQNLFSTLNYPLLALSFLIIFMTGAIDDVFQLKPLVKLAGQALAACVAVAAGLTVGRIMNPFGPEVIELGWVAYPITVVYLVAYVNIINLIDGLDGLASGITFISCCTLFFLAHLAGRADACALSIAVAGATLGFLRYNFNPASIFLGDCGSLLLGFSLGAISLLNVRRVAGLTTIIVPLVISFVPIVDTLSAIIRRKRAHVSVGQADKGHIHHRLIADGYDQKQAVLLMYLWTGLLSVGAVIMTQIETAPRIVVFCILIGASFAFAWHLRLFDPVLLHHYNPKSGEDELVSPDDPAFAIEQAKVEEKHEERREEIVDALFGRSTKDE